MQELFVGLVCILVGAAFCFAGYRFFLILLPIWGFIAGFALGAETAAALFGNGFLATAASWITGIFLGLVLAVASYAVYWIGVTILGASFGAELGSGLMRAFGVDSAFFIWLVAIVFAVAAAWLIISLNIPKDLILVVTALAGASAIVGGLLLWFGSISLSDLGYGAISAAIRSSWWWALAWLVIAAIGFGYQWERTAGFTLDNVALG